MKKLWSGSPQLRKWTMLVLAFTAVLVFMFVVAPLIQQLPGVQQVAQFIE